MCTSTFNFLYYAIHTLRFSIYLPSCKFPYNLFYKYFCKMCCIHQHMFSDSYPCLPDQNNLDSNHQNNYLYIFPNIPSIHQEFPNIPRQSRKMSLLREVPP